MSLDDITALANDALDMACLVIQTKLKVDNGDLAAHFFSCDTVLNELKTYITLELKRKS